MECNGHVNPESRGNGFDRTRTDGLAATVDTLLNAWFATDDKKYSDRIVHLLRVFFLDEVTRMNPSLTYGPDHQSILCAFEFLKPFGSGERPWPYLQIDEITGEKCTTLNNSLLASFGALSARIKSATTV